MNDRTLAARRTFARLLASVVLVTAVSIPATVMIGGCSSGSSGSAEEPTLVVVNFNQNLLPGVQLNSPLVFKFSAPVDPASVNSSTIEIWTTINQQRVDALGAFEVNGTVVIWRPNMTSQVYPVHNGGPSNAALPTMPIDSGLNTLWKQGLTYNVTMASASASPNTVRSIGGRRLAQSFVSQFETSAGPDNLTTGNTNTMSSVFDRNAEFFRDTIRVADPYIYSGTAFPPTDYVGWMSNPSVTNGENPLYAVPGPMSTLFLPPIVEAGITQWTNRDRTGLDTDAAYRVRLVPPLSANDMMFSTFPTGGVPREERYISNLLGVTQARIRGVSSVVLFFSQPLAPDSFLTSNNNPKQGGTGPGTSPIVIRNPMVPTTTPTETPLTYTLAFVNDTATQTARVDCTFNQPITQGWIHIDIRVNEVKGMPGGALQGNLSATDFKFLWPVRINAP